MSAAAVYERLTRALAAEDAVLGLVIAGSYAKGLQGDDSDIDIYSIVRPGLREADVNSLKTRLNEATPDNPKPDLSNNAFQTLEAFESYAQVGSQYEWDRYNLVHTITLIDKTNGQLQHVLNQKKVVSDDEVNIIVGRSLGAYINLSYRSLKSSAANRLNDSLLDAAEALPSMLNCLFALHNRVRPYNKYLKWELTQNALHVEGIDPARLYDTIVRFANGDAAAQTQLFAVIKLKATQRGYTYMYSAWGKKLAILDK